MSHGVSTAAVDPVSVGVKYLGTDQNRRCDQYQLLLWLTNDPSKGHAAGFDVYLKEPEFYNQFEAAHSSFLLSRDIARSTAGLTLAVGKQCGHMVEVYPQLKEYLGELSILFSLASTAYTATANSGDGKLKRLRMIIENTCRIFDLDVTCPTEDEDLKKAIN